VRERRCVKIVSESKHDSWSKLFATESSRSCNVDIEEKLYVKGGGVDGFGSNVNKENSG